MVFSRSHFFILVLCGLSCICSATWATEVKTRHNDERRTLKLLLEPELHAQLSANSAPEAEKFLRKQAAKFGLSPDLKHIYLAREKESLTARHYYFQQVFDGIDLARSEIVVSIGKANNQVLKVYNTTYPVSKSDVAQLAKARRSAVMRSAVMKSTEAMQKAWQLQPRGSRLLNAPTAKRVYIRYKNQFRLVYTVSMKSRPLGGRWEYSVDAYDGKILQVKRLDVPYKRQEGYDNFDLQIQKYNGKTRQSFAEARQSVKARPQKSVAGKSASRLVDGSARVFDPDPRTTLNDGSLTIDSPLSAFEAAYLTVPLLDIDFSNGIYSLIGPWVNIVDLESPSIAPSTTSDGNWFGTRDQTAFYDAMVYYHVDKSQRYLQSLGYTGETGIQELSIEADPNGESQNDNASYDPGSNQLFFGKHPACVGNAEDADVIWHEYGHAILYGINDNWIGGDSDAIQEGFSDYWAGSYSVTTPNGQIFNPDWVFNWNGHTDCWEGRFLDKTNMRYNPALSPYAAHARHSGGYSDELWSTPLFQSLQELLVLGVPQTEVDSLLIEANFGLSTGVTMPEMAELIVDTAENLFPEGPHARVFRSWFYRMEILASPLSLETHLLSSAGSNAIADPGEFLDITLPLTNEGFAPMQNIEIAVVAENSEVVILQGTNSIATIAENETNASSVFRFFLPFSYACGEDLALAFNIQYLDTFIDTTITKTLDLDIEVGESSIDFQSVSPALAIPDNNATGVRSTLSISGGSPIQANDVRVWLDISHTYSGDLSIELTPPSGNNTVRLWSEQGGANPDIVGFLPDDYLLSDGSLDALIGEDPNGVWTLRVLDTAGEDVGTLNAWGLEIRASLGCDDPAPADELVFGNTILQDTGTNAVIDPGEFIQLSLPLYNSDISDLTNVSVVLQTPANVELINDTVSLSAPLGFGQEGVVGPFDIKIPADYDCSQDLVLNFLVNFEGPQGRTEVLGTKNLDVNNQNLNNAVFPSLPIPDFDVATNSAGVVRSELTVSESLRIDPANFSVYFEISHSSVLDLEVTLTSPEGTEIKLLENRDEENAYFTAEFPNEIEPLDSFMLLDGENTQGVWTLTVSDLLLNDIGELLSWGIRAVDPVNCQSANNAPQALITENNRRLNQNTSVTLSASASRDPDGDILQYTWSQTAGPGVVLNNAASATPDFVVPSVAQGTTFSFQVTVVDGFGATATATESVRIRGPLFEGRNNTGGGGSWDRSSLLLLCFLCLCLSVYRRQQKRLKHFRFCVRWRYFPGLQKRRSEI